MKIKKTHKDILEKQVSHSGEMTGTVTERGRKRDYTEGNSMRRGWQQQGACSWNSPQSTATV